jgi:hypothetical protein
VILADVEVMFVKSEDMKALASEVKALLKN